MSPPPGIFTQVSVGISSACAVSNYGPIICWGSAGQRGQETSPPFGSFVQVSVGKLFSCGLTTDGEIVCWGDDSIAHDVPPGRYKFVVRRDNLITCAIRTDDTVVCWGTRRADDGQPATSPSGTFADLSSGDDPWCAVRTDGTVACWGTIAGQISPPPGTFSQVATGWNFSCALNTAGGVECWGSNTWDVVTGIPAAPGNVDERVISPYEVEITWTDGPEETYYDLERRVWNAAQAAWTPWVAYTTLDSTRWHLRPWLPKNSTSFIDPFISSGYSYQYRVRACNGSGCSRPADVTVNTAEQPAAPANISAVSASQNDVRVTWDDASADEIFFLIERRVGYGDDWTEWHRMDVVAANTIAYADTWVSRGWKYEYRVSACKIAVCSTPVSSNVVVQ